MALRQTLLPPGSLADLIKLIGEIEPIQFDALLKAVSGERSFSLNEGSLEESSRQIKVPKSTLSFLVAGLSFLYDRVEEGENANSDRKHSARLVVDDLRISYDNDEKKEILIDRLGKLFAPNAAHQSYKKSLRLQKGFLPNAIDISSFVDIRPMISDDRRSIDGYLSVYQICIETDADNSESGQFLFQLNASVLSKFVDALNDIKKKDDLIKTSRFVNVRRLDPLP